MTKTENRLSLDKLIQLADSAPEWQKKEDCFSKAFISDFIWGGELSYNTRAIDPETLNGVDLEICRSRTLFMTTYYATARTGGECIARYTNYDNRNVEAYFENFNKNLNKLFKEVHKIPAGVWRVNYFDEKHGGFKAGSNGSSVKIFKDIADGDAQPTFGVFVPSDGKALTAYTAKDDPRLQKAFETVAAKVAARLEKFKLLNAS